MEKAVSYPRVNSRQAEACMSKGEELLGIIGNIGSQVELSRLGKISSVANSTSGRYRHATIEHNTGNLGNWVRHPY